LVYAAGQSVREATPTSLLFVGAAAVVGMVAHYRAGRVRAGVGVAFGLAGIGGSVAGSAANRHADPNVLPLAFSVLVVVAARRMLTGCPTCTRVGEQHSLSSSGPTERADGAGLALRFKPDSKTVVAVLPPAPA
jgi:uncharacterized membrane protein YfcA